MTKIRVLTDVNHDVEGTVAEGRPWVEAADLPELLGWSLRAEGLCRGDACVPLAAERRLRLVEGDRVDLGGIAELLGRDHALSRSAGAGGGGDAAVVIAVALDPASRREALEDLHAPDFTLPDLNGVPHALSDWQGQKKLLVTFASWCGCRYDLPGWQALHDELAPSGFSVIGVAIDNSPADVEPWTEGVTFPVLYDSAHILSELYAISNVPTVVWIDEEDAIVRPNGVAFGSDLFSAFTGVESTPHQDAVRAWVQDGVVPLNADEARAAVADLSHDEILARLYFRLGADALRRGDTSGAEVNLRAASELAPFDWSVRRAAMPLIGEDPFGADFLALYDDWKSQGMPYHGLSATAGLGTPD